MKIGIDASVITKDKAGVGYFAYSLIHDLLKKDKKNSYTLYTNSADNLTNFLNYQNAKVVEIKSKRPNFSWILKVSRINNKENDIFFSPANFTFAILAKNCIQVVHDLAPIKYPQFFTKRGAIMFRLLLKLALLRALAIVTPLEAIRQEIITYSPKNHFKIHSIGAGFHSWSNQDLDSSYLEKIRKKYNLPEKFFLTTGTLEPRKNHVNIIKAVQTVFKTNPEYKYVIVGKKGWFYDSIFKIVKKLKLYEKVIFLGYIPEEDLAGIYYLSSAFIFCSIYEGFGFPPLEAAIYKKPLVLSDIDSLKEIFGNKIDYVDPNDYLDISKGIRKAILLESNEYPETLKKYTWDNTSKNFLDLLESINLN
jgi:glycosyltransferase involved in cell wall biosynthesis